MSSESPTLNSEVTDILNSMKKVRDTARERLRASRNQILFTLKELGATRVVVSYSGSGDAGQVDQVEVFRDDVKLPINIPTSILVASSNWSHVESRWVESTELKSMSLEDALTEFVYDWLQAEHAGWENNDGASGECTITVSEGQFLLGHTTYYTEHDYQESAI